MRTLNVGVSSRADVEQRIAGAFRGEQQGEHLSFASAELFLKMLTARRLALLAAMRGQGVLSIREVARRVRRDVKHVHADIRALLDMGALEQADGGVVFPYDRVSIRLDIPDLHAA